MSLVAVLRKDFRDSVRSRSIWITVGVFSLFAGLLTFAYTNYFQPPALQSGGTPEQYTVGLALLFSGQILPGIGPVPLVVPIIGLLLGHKAIVGERETGQLKFLLGLPHSRADVVFGKLLGRAAVAGVAVVVGFLVAALLLVQGGGLAPGVFLGLVAVTLLFALAYVAVGIGISAGVSSGSSASVLLVAAFALFQVGWGGIFTIVRSVHYQESTPPDWFAFLRSIGPGNAYNGALNAALTAAGGNVDELLRGGRAGPTSEPFFLADWFGIVVLALWVVAPLAIGYVLFERADLG